MHDKEPWRDVKTWHDVIQVFQKAMNNKLRDHIKGKLTEMRGRKHTRVSMEFAEAHSAGKDTASPGRWVEEMERQAKLLTALNVALNQLRDLDLRLYEVISLRALSDKSVCETAQAVGISERSVEADTKRALLWMKRFMNDAVERSHDAGEVSPDR